MRLGVAVRRRADRVGRRSARWRRRRSFACTFVRRELGHVGKPEQLVPASRRSGARGRSARRCAIEVHLAPEDPRRVDLERRALVEAAARDAAVRGALRRRRPRSASSSRPRAALRRDLVRPRRTQDDEPRRRRRKACSKRSTSSPASSRRAENDDEVFRGHPLAVAAERRRRRLLRHLAGRSSWPPHFFVRRRYTMKSTANAVRSSHRGARSRLVVSRSRRGRHQGRSRARSRSASRR